MIDFTRHVASQANPIERFIAIEIALEAYSRYHSFRASNPKVRVTAIVIGLDYGSLPAKFYETENSDSVREFTLSTFIPPQKRVKITRFAKFYLAEFLASNLGKELTKKHLLKMLEGKVTHNLQHQNMSNVKCISSSI